MSNEDKDKSTKKIIGDSEILTFDWENVGRLEARFFGNESAVVKYFPSETAIKAAVQKFGNDEESK